MLDFTARTLDENPVNVARSRNVLTSNRCTTQSLVAHANVLPSKLTVGLTTTLTNRPKGVPNCATRFPVATSHISSTSSPCVDNRLLFGKNRISWLPCGCPTRESNKPICSPLCTSHNSMPPSLPDAKVRPSGLNATPFSARLFPTKILWTERVATFHKRTV